MNQKPTYEQLELEIERLKKDNEEYRFLVDSSLDMIWKMNTKLVFTYVSPSIFDMAGYTQEEWIGKRLSKFTNFPEFLNMARRALVSLKNYKTKPTVQFDARVFHKNGEMIDCEIVSRLIYNKEGIPVGFIGSTRDISLRKKAERMLKENEARLKEINAEKDKFFSIVAHDLRSPFHSMLGFSNILIDNMDRFDRNQQKEYLGIIKQQAESTLRLLENLLLWSRSQRGVFEFNPKELNLNLLVDETIALMNQSVEKKSIRIENKTSERFHVVADKNMISTILRNLLSNAVKFTPKEGKVSVTAEIISDSDGKKAVEIAVIDNGVGISEEIKSKLFDIKENVTTYGTENETGSGLGLFLCKDFIEKHGGEIKVESEVGSGSKFIISIPLS